MRQVATILSYLFFPLVIPIYGMLLLFSYPLFSFYPTRVMLTAYLTIIIFGTLIPVMFILVLNRSGIVSDIQLTKQRERFLPYLSALFSYLVGTWMIYKIRMPMFVVGLMLAVAAALLVNVIVNIRWKISGHATGVGGLLGGILSVSYLLRINPLFWIIVIVLVCGMIAAARIYLKAHTPAQVLAGFLNGICWAILIPSLPLNCIFPFSS